MLMAYGVFGVKLSAIVMGPICIFTSFHVVFEMVYTYRPTFCLFFLYLFPFLLVQRRGNCSTWL